MYRSLTLAVALFAVPAAAHPNAHGHQPSPGSDALHVDELSATAVRGAVEIRYRVRASDLARWRQRGIEPALRVDLGRRAEVIRLTADDVVRLSPEGRPPSHVDVSLVDTRPGRGPADLNLDVGPVTVSSLRLPVGLRAAPSPSPLAWSRHPDVVAACRAALPFSARESCERAVEQTAFRPVALIQACDRAFVGKDDTLACVTRGAQGPRDPSADVEACDRAFVGASPTLQCVAQAAASPFPMDEVVARCDALFIGEANTQQCVASAQGHRPAIVLRSIDQCDRHVSDDAELRCLERTLGERVAHRGR